jgi:hypothetical protein
LASKGVAEMIKTPFAFSSRIGVAIVYPQWSWMLRMLASSLLKATA